MLSITNYQRNANQNHNEVTTSHWLEQLSSKKKKGKKENLQTNAREGVEKRESSYTVGGNVNWYGEQYEGPFKNLKQSYHMIQ